MSIFVQAVGLAAAAAGIAAFQIKRVKYLYCVQALSSGLFVVQFYLLGAYSGAAMVIVDTVRSLALAGGKPFVKTKAFLGIFIALGLIAFFSSAEDLSFSVSYLTLLANIVCGIAFWSGKPKLIRYAQLLVISPCWLIYSVCTGSIGGALTQVLTMVSAAVFLFRMRKEVHNA